MTTAAVRCAVAVSTAVAVTAGGAAQAVGARTTVDYRDCIEVTATAAAPAGVVAVVTFTCAAVWVDGRAVGRAAVSEVVLVTSERTRLLRTATDNAALRRALVAAGLPSVPARVALAPAPTTSVDVEHLDARLSATGAAGLVTGTRATVFDGEALEHEHDGPRHRVVTSYANTLSGHRSGPGAGAVLIDAGQDDRLAGWLGGNRAAAGAVVLRGDWVAVITRSPR